MSILDGSVPRGRVVLVFGDGQQVHVVERALLDYVEIVMRTRPDETVQHVVYYSGGSGPRHFFKFDRREDASAIYASIVREDVDVVWTEDIDPSDTFVLWRRTPDLLK